MSQYDQELFLSKVKVHFSNLKLLSEYRGIGNRVLVEDEHGNQFSVFPQSLTRGCPPGLITAIDKNKYFIFLANRVHGNKYDYSLVSYVSAHKKILIKCAIHGEFYQEPCSHVNLGQGCPKCGDDSRIAKRSDSVENFIIKANAVHKGRYSYDNVKYVRCMSKVAITCSIHGDFYQAPNSHLKGAGCPECYIPIGTTLEKWLAFCRERNRSICTLYIIRLFNDNENFIKIGITSRDISGRFGSGFPYSIEIIKEIKGSPDFIWNKEKSLHSEFSDFKYSPLINFNGFTECFSIDILDNLRM